jgi:DNA-binding SARP family transcriptional activator
MGNPIEIYLPLLTSSDPAVRDQATLILLSTYGERGLTYLRRMLDTPELHDQARAALVAIAASSGLHVELRPFRGIYVRCLGELQVFVDTHEVIASDWAQIEGGRAGGRKVQGLFAYLVHCGRRGASRSEICDAVWGHAVSAASLSRTLGALRQVLAQLGSPDLARDALISERDRCTLSPTAYFSDADHFERTFDLACQSEEREGLAAALPLYHQVLALYEGAYMEAIPRASDWGQERRALIDNSYLIAAERLASHAWDSGSDRHCILICSKALAISPAASDLAALLLRVYARQGLTVDLEHAYRRYLKATSINPLGEPDDEVVETYHELCAARAPR